MRDAYNVPSEQEPLQRFLDGVVDPGWLGDWLPEIGQATRAGRRFRRVRVVSLPLTDYSRFGLTYAAFNNEAGEDIRYLAREDAADLPTFDYWLFDSRTVAKLVFGDQDKLLGFELIQDPAVVVELNYQRDAAWHHAITRDDFAAKHLDKR
ncbi:DUF6879 family protein [Promicromonospora sp. Populi]|uniref:DUF6879 family protein n=1 Tax=Promicromonospora sp. Populi TaxID=3239420 RepID=UPI0034E28DE6